MFIQIEYSLYHKVHCKQIKKKLAQELSTSHGDLHYKHCLHQPPRSDRQPTKEAMRVISLEHSPQLYQTLDGDLCVGEYPASCMRLQKWLATAESRES